MSERNKFNDEKEFINWLEGQTTEAEVTDELWQQRVNVASSVAHQAEIEQQKNVPNWNREAAFSSDHQPWWQWRALPAMSMAFSVLAIALVLFKVELVIQPEGLMLSFAGGGNAKQEATVSALVDLKLREFAAEQQVMLANYATDFTANQQDSNLQLATYVIGAARQERKEDMSDFINYFNEQRKDESFNQKIKYQQLERKINRSSYQNSIKPKLLNNTDEFSYQIEPANFTTEE
ncbi:MAG: hypothetical protein MJK12_09125 [Colwellia sp.]|nr:hypothetical protein [Colwellia sp.]